jgi:hypothetical protein
VVFLATIRIAMLVMDKTARYYQEAQTVPLQSFSIEPNIIKRHPNSSHEAKMPFISSLQNPSKAGVSVFENAMRVGAAFRTLSSLRSPQRTKLFGFPMAVPI